MECNRTLLSAYVDQELDPSTSEAVSQHTKTCPTCRQDLLELQQLNAGLADPALRYRAPSHLRHRIQTDLDAVKSRARHSSGRKFNWLNLGMAAGGSVALAFSLVLYLSLPSAVTVVNQEIVASHYRSLLANHMADVASSDHHTVRPWFTGKLDYAPPVQDFADHGFTLIGGRLDYINQRTVAALAYRHGSHLINVFVWPDRASHTPSSSTIQGFHLLQWTDDGMAFSAVSDTSEDELEHLRQLMVQHAPANLR